MLSQSTLFIGFYINISLLVLGFGSVFGHNCSVETDNNCTNCNIQNNLGNYCSGSKLGVYNKYAVSTDAKYCATVGKKILEKGGNAIDSTVAVILCMGVTTPESLGLGGGSFIMIYNASSGQSVAIDARETAPSGATPDMYNKTSYQYSTDGPLAIAVPGQLAGLWHMFSNHGSGRVKWSDLFTDSIKLCEKGFPVTEHLSDALQVKENQLRQHKEEKDIFIDPKTNRVYKKGDTLVQKQLGNTLRRLAQSSDPMTTFYEVMAKQIMDDIWNASDWSVKPIITVNDFNNYSVKVRQPVVTDLKLRNITLHSFPLPGSGAVLSSMLNVMEGFTDLYPGSQHSKANATLFYHRLIETLKFSFAKRMNLGDPDFDVSAIDVSRNLTSDEFADYVRSRIDDSKTYKSASGHYDSQVHIRDDHGTAHAIVVDADGNAVSVTSTINTLFGSKVMSESTGILLNNQMDDFNTGADNEFGIPPSDQNKIQAHKRPMSSMVPSIFTDHNGVRLVIGAAGGPKITTSVASVAIRHLWFDEDIKQAIDDQRLHHQLFPDKILYEKCFPKDILCGLQAKGHKMEVITNNGDWNNRGAIVTAIARRYGRLYANTDYRKGGAVDGL